MTGAKKTIEKKQSNILEIIFIVDITIAWCVWQVLSILQVDTGILGQSEYVMHSFVGKENVIPASEYGVAWIYMNILRAVFYVVGNHANAVLWLQFAFQFLGAFLLYRGMRKLLGRVAAVILYIGALAIPFLIFPVGIAEPLWVVFLADALIIYLIAALINSVRKRKVCKEDKNVTDVVKSDVVKPDLVKPDVVKPEMAKPADKTAEQTEKEEKPKVKLLDNPLPGPKKHVSKVLDYDLQLERMPRVFMRYDIKVADDDDFDIK